MTREFDPLRDLTAKEWTEGALGNMTHEPITPADLELLNPEVQNSIICFEMDLKYLPPDHAEVMGLHFTLLTAALIASQKRVEELEDRERIQKLYDTGRAKPKSGKL